MARGGGSSTASRSVRLRAEAGHAALIIATVFALAGGVAAASPLPQHPAPRTPRIGFSFRPHTAAGMGMVPAAALRRLLTQVDPDVVRLPVYWSDVAPRKDATLDFSSVDVLVREVLRHRRVHGTHQTSIVLDAGMRVFGYPEFFAPAWAQTGIGAGTSQLTASASFQAYLRATVERYRGLAALDTWQVENEPLDTSSPDQDTSLSQAQVATEVALVHTEDRAHPVMVTSFNSTAVDLDREGIAEELSDTVPLPGPQPGGHPDQSLRLGDILGLDVYAFYAGVNLHDADVPTRIAWKADTLRFWAQRAAAQHRPLWIAEFEAGPWAGESSGFTPAMLLDEASSYRNTGAGTILLWGVEAWLQHPEWLHAGSSAIDILTGVA